MRVETSRGVINAPKRLLNFIALATAVAAENYKESEEYLYEDMFKLHKELFSALYKEGYYD